MTSEGSALGYPFLKALKGVVKILAILAISYLAIYLLNALLGDGVDYRNLPILGSRNLIWLVAQVHLLLGAFLLGVPMFAVTVELIGWKKGDGRFDRLAHDFTRLFTLTGTIAAILGGILLVSLFILYPGFSGYMRSIYSPTWHLYIGLVLGEVISMYLYYYSWKALEGRKGMHILLGIILNLFGIAIVFVTDIWVAFMMTPGGVDEKGNLVSMWDAINTYAWMPLNIHRLIANVAFGGSIAAAYGAYRFLSAGDDERRAYYDWMGYIGNFIAMVGLIPLPFAGYLLAMEIYAFNEQMGISMMGGTFSWLWFMQAVIIGAIFLAANYYLWTAMEKIEGAERYRGYRKYLLLVIVVCYGVWLTPHSLVATVEEARALGGAFHPVLGVFGVMAAKITAVFFLIMATFLSFMLYRRSDKRPTVSWAGKGNLLQVLLLILSAGAIIFLGVYGYFVPAAVRIRMSMAQVVIVFIFMVLFLIIEYFLYRNAEAVGRIRWGDMPGRSQYALIFLAITFTWLMGLMGYIRSGIRKFWHIYGVMPDRSPQAYLPAHGVSTFIISIAILIFFLLISLVFWMAREGRH